MNLEGSKCWSYCQHLASGGNNPPSYSVGSAKSSGRVLSAFGALTCWIFTSPVKNVHVAATLTCPRLSGLSEPVQWKEEPRNRNQVLTLSFEPWQLCFEQHLEISITWGNKMFYHVGRVRLTFLSLATEKVLNETETAHLSFNMQLRKLRHRV